MKRVLCCLVMMLGLSAVACGGNACDDAVDKLEECGGDTSEVEDRADECNEQDECAAECINDASCSEIMSTDLNNSFYSCVAKCGS